ncbi:hypothetical protein Tco_0042981, partial [Tanacetum coccineum]
GKLPIEASTLPNVDLPIDPNMPDLEDDYDAFSSDGIFNGAYDDENVGVVADFNNIDCWKHKKYRSLTSCNSLSS